MSLYDMKVIKGKRQRVWNKGRCRGLNEAKERIGDLSKEVRKLLRDKRKIRVLEVGCGYGKALLELRKEFGNRVEIHGINLEPRWNLKIVRKFGLAEKIFTKVEINKNLPKIHICDLGLGTSLPSNYFDLIYSYASFQYIHDKAKALEEVNRLLTKDGLAIIELDEYKRKHPPEYKHIFEIWKGDKKINPITYIKRHGNITARRIPGKWHILRMKKTPRFNLGLKFITSFDTHEINPKWRGDKVIYVVK